MVLFAVDLFGLSSRMTLVARLRAGFRFAFFRGRLIVGGHGGRRLMRPRLVFAADGQTELDEQRSQFVRIAVEEGVREFFRERATAKRFQEFGIECGSDHDRGVGQSPARRKCRSRD